MTERNLSFFVVTNCHKMSLLFSFRIYFPTKTFSLFFLVFYWIKSFSQTFWQITFFLFSICEESHLQLLNRSTNCVTLTGLIHIASAMVLFVEKVKIFQSFLKRNAENKAENLMAQNCVYSKSRRRGRGGGWMSLSIRFSCLAPNRTKDRTLTLWKVGCDCFYAN